MQLRLWTRKRRRRRRCWWGSSELGQRDRHRSGIDGMQSDSELTEGGATGHQSFTFICLRQAQRHQTARVQLGEVGKPLQRSRQLPLSLLLSFTHYATGVHKELAAGEDTRMSLSFGERRGSFK